MWGSGCWSAGLGEGPGPGWQGVGTLTRTLLQMAGGLSPEVTAMGQLTPIWKPKLKSWDRLYREQCATDHTQELLSSGAVTVGTSASHSTCASASSRVTSAFHVGSEMTPGNPRRWGREGGGGLILQVA